jgi:hypothetical protein
MPRFLSPLPARSAEQQDLPKSAFAVPLNFHAAPELGILTQVSPPAPVSGPRLLVPGHRALLAPFSQRRRSSSGSFRRSRTEHRTQCAGKRAGQNLSARLRRKRQAADLIHGHGVPAGALWLRRRQRRSRSSSSDKQQPRRQRQRGPGSSLKWKRHARTPRARSCPASLVCVLVCVCVRARACVW